MEARELNHAVEDYFNAGGPAMDAYYIRKSIYEGTPEGPITANGQTYTPEQLAGLNPVEREAIGNRWLAEQGILPSDISDAWNSRDELRAGNANLDAYLDMKSRADDYPGGAEQFVADLRRTNPSYDQHMRDIELTNPPGSEEYLAAAFYPGAMLAAKGVRDSTYDPISGFDNTGQTTMADQVAAATDLAYGEYQSQKQADFHADMDAKIENWWAVQQLWTPVVRRRHEHHHRRGQIAHKHLLWLQGLRGGAGVHHALLNKLEAEYVAHVMGGGDPSVDSWLDNRPSSGKADATGVADFDPEAVQEYLGATPGTPIATAPANARLVVSESALDLRTGPGAQNQSRGLVDPQIPLQLIQVTPEGWAEVAIGMTSGWVPAQYLTYAA